MLANKSENDDEELSKVSAINKEYILQPGDTIYMVRKRDTVERIASRFHVNKQILKMANNLSSNKVNPGKQLIIPTSTRSSGQLLASSIDKKLQPGDTVYMVRQGDTFERIAQRFKTTPAAIRLANLMEDHTLQEGEKLIVPTHMRG